MPITIERLDNDYHFVARNDTGNEIQMDGSPAIGGHNLGARPMQVLLMALGGCSSRTSIAFKNSVSASSVFFVRTFATFCEIMKSTKNLSALDFSFIPQR